MAASVSAVADPSTSGSVELLGPEQGYVDYYAVAHPEPNVSVLGWGLYCHACNSVVASANSQEKWTVPVSSLESQGHPGPFTITCYFSGKVWNGHIILYRIFEGVATGDQPGVFDEVLDSGRINSRQTVWFALDAPNIDGYTFITWKYKTSGTLTTVEQEANIHHQFGARVALSSVFYQPINPVDKGDMGYAYYSAVYRKINQSLLFGIYNDGKLLYGANNTLVSGVGVVRNDAVGIIPW